MADLSHRAMLVTLSLRAWKGTVTDREIAASAELANKAEAGTMTVIKELTPKHIIAPIKAIMNTGRQEHYKMTTPGLVRGQHLLATAMFEQYMLTQREIMETFNEAVDVFIRLYPSIREKAKNRLGTAYREADFPTASAIRGYFEYSYKPSPIPSTVDWRLDNVSPQEIKDMRDEVENSIKDMFTTAAKDVMERCKAIIEKLAKQAEHYSPSAPGAMLRDTTIENMKEMAALAYSMNVTNDPQLAKMAEGMQQFVHLTGAELRGSAQKREDVKKAAQALLQKMVNDKRTKKAA